jgi:hypothetical protein
MLLLLLLGLLVVGLLQAKRGADLLAAAPAPGPVQ